MLLAACMFVSVRVCLHPCPWVAFAWVCDGCVCVHGYACEYVDCVYTFIIMQVSGGMHVLRYSTV